MDDKEKHIVAQAEFSVEESELYPGSDTIQTDIARYEIEKWLTSGKCGEPTLNETLPGILFKINFHLIIV